MKSVEIAPGYTASPIIKGCWQLSSGHGAGDPRKAIADLMAFVDAGVTTFDCADIYTGVEETLGGFRKVFGEERGTDALAELRFHTKFVPDLGALSTIRRQYVGRIIDRSLKRLGMERLDLVQFHWWDFRIPGYVETAGYLQDLQRAGKIGHLGVTNFDTAHLREIVDSGIEIVSNQVQYSVLDLRPEHGMSALCEQYGINLLCYGTIAGGFLSEQYLHVPEPTGEMPNRSLTKYKLVIDDIGGWPVFQQLMTALASVAAKHQVGVSEVAAAFILQQQAVAAVILGGSARRLDGIRRLSTLQLDPTEADCIRSARGTTSGLKGDVYEIERQPGKHAAIMRYNLNAQAGSGGDG